MALLNQIQKWTETLADYQRDAARRLLQNDTGLAQEDYKELYELLKAGHGLSKAENLKAKPLSVEHLPAEKTTGDTVILKALRNLKNVNKIAPNQILNFATKGLTVIYGGNGSGKSGYARVMKRACRARDQIEHVYPNANDPAAADAIPTAVFDLEVAGNSKEVTWSRDSTAPEQLSTIGVFDSKCARSYLTAENDVAYLPYGLDIVENLANQVLPELSRMLKEEIDAIDIDKQPYENLLGETEVGKHIEVLAASSDAAAIKSLGTLSKEDTQRLDELIRALAVADPMAKANELRLSATRLKSFAEKIVNPLAWVSDGAVEKLKKLDEANTTAEAAEAKAAQALQAGEDLLPGTGAQVWKLLFDVARRYSTEVAYTDSEFPNIVDGAVCPLCQEPLTDAAGQRLTRFDQYIKNDVAKNAKAERQKLQAAKDKIERANLQVVNDQAIVEEVGHLDGTLPQIIEAFETSLEERRYSMLDCLETHDWPTIPKLPEIPRAKTRQLAARQLMASRTYSRAADEKNKRKMICERDELAARQSLSKSLKAVLALLQRMKDKVALERCQPSLRTKPISDKSKQFTSDAVTKELKKALDQEFQALGVGHIQTKLKGRSERGKLFHQLLLDLPTVATIDQILSEGEQRAIALGSFLAELALANHSCGIVFDDPVSSLDHKRRGKLANRLAQESLTRQVVVFTHEVVFLQQLRDECESQGASIALCFLESAEPYTGKITEGLPWIHKSFKERISKLDANCKRFEKLPWPTEPSEELASEMIRQYSFIRATIERIVQDLALNGTVQRFRDYIEVSKLRKVVGLEEAEVTEILRLNQRCHDTVEAHDPSSAKDLPPPTAAELRKDVDDLKAVIKRINDRRNSSKPITTTT